MSRDLFKKSLKEIYNSCSVAGKVLSNGAAPPIVRNNHCKTPEELSTYLGSPESKALNFNSNFDGDAISAYFANRYRQLISKPETKEYSHPLDVGFTMKISSDVWGMPLMRMLCEINIAKLIHGIGHENGFCFFDVSNNNNEINIIFLTKRKFMGNANELFKFIIAQAPKITNKSGKKCNTSIMVEKIFLLPIAENFDIKRVMSRAFTQPITENHLSAIDHALNAVSETFMSMSSFVNIDEAIQNSFRDAIMPRPKKERFNYEA